MTEKPSPERTAGGSSGGRPRAPPTAARAGWPRSRSPPLRSCSPWSSVRSSSRSATTTSSRRCRYFFTYPWDFFAEAGKAIGDVLLGAAHRLGRLAERHRDHARARGAADLRRPRRDAGLPRRAVQHRCPGPARWSAPCAPGTSASPGTCPPGSTCWRPSPRAPRRRALGRDRRPPQGPDRRPRGDHHDHAQLHGRLGAALRAEQGGLPAAGQRQPLSPPVERLGPLPRRARHPPRHGRRPAGGRAGVVAARAQHARLRAARRRRQRRRLPDRRHERRRRSTPWHGARRRARRPRRHHERAGPPATR